MQEKHLYIGYKERNDYPATKKIYWTQKLVGPFTDDETAQQIKNLKLVKKSVKGIQVFEEWVFP